MQTNDFCSDLRKKVRQVKAIKPPPEMARMKAGKDIYFERQAKAEMGSSVDEESLSLPGAQFGTYHLKHRRETFGPRGNDQPSLDLPVFRRQSVFEKLEKLTVKLRNKFGAPFEDKVLMIGEIPPLLGVHLLEYMI
ncbi:hypothetical protein FOIG_12683 [Fusarium odoratissimum NRRL 54006]|uniref:Uncharacterized protein n=2 Tax=Fusarium oxysporum species complex TaxID=171631 RepID=X0KBZ4_FUSO5|nr:uncharacterized protein FOIG_12683 [Fusarium odoratissimum NRRL 54006]EXL94489.1 hypothetical protein FOIG_12683 [Fusarium odoratissimum NRRL 54006]TXB97240.1 hypothetical protein FocTR4_00010992 [Fusarium oxysporum f. sp. cubense]